ncbi:MAG: ribosome-associated translation inhibitor RaiA [Saprospiraceae bacterium]
MKILIESPFYLSDEHKENIESKLSQLSTFNKKITQVDVFFKLDDGLMPNAVTAEIHLHIPGPEIFVSEVKEDYWDAFSGAFDKTKRQIRKSKEIKKDSRVIINGVHTF